MEVQAEQVGLTPDAQCVKGVSKWENLFGYTAFDGTPYDGRCSFFGTEKALPEEAGWSIVIGIGGLFSFLTSLIICLTNRSQNGYREVTSERFSFAGRDIEFGLTAADIVSKWTWAATLLQSSNVAFKYGVSGPFWYASGATIQILLFAVLAVEIKRKCPAIHTVLEVVRIRWGGPAHRVFLCFCLSTNLIVTAMLILGGAAVINVLSGVETYAACFLIPISVSTYTAFGGLRATYYASYTHTAVIYGILLFLLYKIYLGPSDLGSIAKTWENLRLIAQKSPVDGNADGSYLTMYSSSGLIFGIVNIVGNFGTVFVDQCYWQGAIACRPSATFKGYLVGGMAWFAIPFSMATACGLAARALDLPITMAEADQGLVPPAVAVHLLGPTGAFLITLQLFLAVTSTANKEQLAVASLFAYDIYYRRLNPQATGTQVIFVSRFAVVVWSVISGIVAVMLFELDISLGWVYMAMGNFVGSAVAPIAFSLLWKNCSARGAIAGAIGGLAASLAGWVGMAWRVGEGRVDVDTLGRDMPMLTGNVLALLVSPVLCVAVSVRAPQNFDWSRLQKRAAHNLVEQDPHSVIRSDESQDGKASLDSAARITWRVAAGLSLFLVVGWPLLGLPAGEFSKGYFTFWVALAFAWAHVAAFVTVLWPVWEARHAVWLFFCCRFSRSRPDDAEEELTTYSRRRNESTGIGPPGTL